MNNLLNAVVAANQGIVHPFFITSDQILRQLETVIGLLPPGKTFPIDDITNVSAQVLLEISSVKVLLKHQYLVCVVSIPLIEADKTVKVLLKHQYLVCVVSIPLIEADKTDI
ncbi:hypothetical protein QE152_g6124 [Popillia japonica]|uniref:Uncharacterized protein n=1 Tax=Popillia japonica TaxID=7064 RepID=A0AAW1MK08_POPJA